MEIKSIWDNWERQCYNIRQNGNASCALGFLDQRFESGDAYREVPLCIESVRLVAGHIRVNFPHLLDMIRRVFAYSADDLWGDDGCVVAQANNLLKLTPEQFREIDRLTQIEAAVKPLVDSVAVQEPEQIAK